MSISCNTEMLRNSIYSNYNSKAYNNTIIQFPAHHLKKEFRMPDFTRLDINIKITNYRMLG